MCPAAATNTVLESFGSTAMRPIAELFVSPMLVHVAPLSVDL